MKSLPIAALLLFTAVTAPASAATFNAPRTVSTGVDAQQVVAAPGALALQGSDGVWLATGSGDARRISPAGQQTSQVKIAADPGEQPVVAWVDAESRVHAYSAAVGDQVIEGSLARIRAMTATSSAIGWIGVSAGNDRLIQIAGREENGRFGPARAPGGQLGRPSYGLAAAGSTFAWHAQDGDRRRIEALSAGDPPAWLTPAGEDATTPSLAIGRGGAGVLAWMDGIPTRGVSLAPVVGGRLAGPVQSFAAPSAGALRVAVGGDGTAVAAWAQQDGIVRATLRRPGGAFGEPVSFASPDGRGLDVAVTAEGDATLAYIVTDRLNVAVARAGRPFGTAEPLADGAEWVAAADGDVSWIQGRVVRTAHLAGAPVIEPAAAGDRRKPKLRVKVLKRKGGKARVRVRSDERGVLRATWRSRKQVVARSRGKLRRGVPRVIATKARRRLTVTIRVTDAAGNVAQVKKKLR